jgi:uncharacterized phage-like protein YoqJ
MTEYFINKARACAVTGHRSLEKDFSLENLKQIFIKLIDAGFDTFLVGMALGFDIECFKVLTQLKEKYSIKTIACIPCETQTYKFTIEQKEIYDKLLDTADQTILVSKNYTSYCMMKRNKFMVDNCSLLVSYLRRDFGGTYNTVEYAKKQSIQILNV